MKDIPINKKKYNNYKLDKRKYNTSQEENDTEIELINEMNNIYLIQKEIYYPEKIKNSKGSRQDKMSPIINVNNSPDFLQNKINKKRLFSNNSLNPFCFDNNNYDDNIGDDMYNAQLIKHKNHNYLITGSKGKYSNSNKFNNNSLSKKDPKKISNMAKTLKLFNNNKGSSSYINYNYNINTGKRNYLSKNIITKDYSNDNIKDNNRIIRNFEIHTNNSKNKGSPMDRPPKRLDIKNNKLLLNINKDMLSTKLNIKNKIVNEENKSKTPLKVNARYFNNNSDNQRFMNNNNMSNNHMMINATGDNEVNREQNKINEFLEKDEWNPNAESEEIINDIEDDKDIISYKIDIRDFSERDNQVIKISNTEDIIKFDDVNDDDNLKDNIEKNKIPSYTATNFSNKRNKYEQNYINLIKDYQKSNQNDKTMKTPKTIKDNTAMDLIFSKSGNNYRIQNNVSYKNSFTNDPLLQKVNNITINNSNLKTQTPSTNINNDNSTPTVNINIQQKINNINNMHQPQIHIFDNQINNNNSNKNIITQISPQKFINNNCNNNNLQLNGIENNNINKKNIFIKQKSKTNVIFQKKNRSPPAFQKKPNLYNDIKKFELTENNKSISKINNQMYKESSPIIHVKKINDNSNNNIYNIKNNLNYTTFNNKDKDNNIESNKNSVDLFNKTNNFINTNINNNTINKPNGTIYKRQKVKPLKKVPIQQRITKGKLDTRINNEIKKDDKNSDEYDKINNNVNNNEIINHQRPIEIINKKKLMKNHIIIKLYDYYINYPKIELCHFSKEYIKTIKIPKIKVCNMSKIHSVIYILYKNKSICYITKKRTIIKKIIKPPINDNCQCIKNIVLIPPNDNKNKILAHEKQIVPENKSPIAPKKNKKRKKRRKTRRLHKGNDNKEKNNNNEDNNSNDNNEEEKGKVKEKENDNFSKEENEEEKNINNNYDNDNDINNNTDKNNLDNNIEFYIENNTDNYNNDNNLNNDGINTNENAEKIPFSEKEIIIPDMVKNNSMKKKLSLNTYNDEEYNEEENDDFRIASEDELSEDKLKKKESLKENKTEGKEIIYESDKNKIDKKLTDIQKKVKGLELLEKIQGKRYSFTTNEIDNINLFNNDSNNVNDYENKNKNILFITNKLNEIFNNPKKYENENNQIENENEDENDDDYTNSNVIFSDEEIKNSGTEKYNNINIDNSIKNKTYIKKNNTFKKNVDYAKIGSIFDKLEGIFDKKKTSENIEEFNNENIYKEKYKTPLLIKNTKNERERITDFNLKDSNNNIYNKYYIESNNCIEVESNNYIENDSNNDNDNDNENNDYSEDKKSTNITKYKEIFNNKQQIISKLELLMNKQKNKTNQDNSNINEFMYSSPKILSEIDSDMNINKDTPGNRREIKKNNLLKIQNSINNKNIKKYTYEEILSYKNKKICLKSNLLSINAINHCNEIFITLQEEYSSFKKNYKDIIINTNNNYNYNNNNSIIKSDKELSMAKWARKDMTKEIEEAEKYIKELNIKMSQDNYKYKIIEILNTLTVDNYKNILNKIIEMVYLSENNNKIELNKPEYLLHNQCILVEIILDKATIEKGYVVLYAKLCADLFIEYIKLIKEYNNPEIENQLIDGENLKTILTSECRQRFDECVSVSTLSKNLDDEEKKEIFLIFKKKFLGNMNFIAELINVKILSQTKGFEFLDILYKRYIQIKNNDKIKYLNLEGAVTLLTKFGKIVTDRQNPKHMQNLDNYMKDNICPIISNNNEENDGLPNYLKFKIINLIEKQKNNWKDSLYEQSIVAKGRNNNNISFYHDGNDSNININIDESWTDGQKLINNAIRDKEDSIITLLKNDIENYVSFLNDHEIENKKDLNEYNNKNENSDINNEYDWSISEELIIKTKNELEEIIRCYIEVCIDYVTKEKTIFYCNEYIKNIINYYSVDLNKEEAEKVHMAMNDLYLNIEDICIDNYYMLEIMGYLMFILMNNNLFFVTDFDKFMNEDKNKIIKITQVTKFALAHSEDKFNELYELFKTIKLFETNKNIFEEYIINPLKNDHGINPD